MTFALRDMPGNANKSGGRGAGHDAQSNGRPLRTATQAAAGGQAATMTFALSDMPGDTNKGGSRGRAVTRDQTVNLHAR